MSCNMCYHSWSLILVKLEWRIKGFYVWLESALAELLHVLNALEKIKLALLLKLPLLILVILWSLKITALLWTLFRFLLVQLLHYLHWSFLWLKKTLLYIRVLWWLRAEDWLKDSLIWFESWKTSGLLDVFRWFSFQIGGKWSWIFRRFRLTYWWKTCFLRLGYLYSIRHF